VGLEKLGTQLARGEMGVHSSGDSVHSTTRVPQALERGPEFSWLPHGLGNPSPGYLSSSIASAVPWLVSRMETP
jgi:hypothetical protein